MRSLYYLSLVKFVAFMATLVKAVESNSSASTGTTQKKDQELSKTLDSCSLVVVSTLDGKLSALDSRQNGALSWSLPAFSGPLLSSSLSSLQSGKKLKIIPSLDGGLYQVNGDKIEAIPYTADNLLGSFYQLQDGSMLVGGKEAISCGIDSQTGKARYLCSADGCKLTNDESEEHIQDRDIFVVKRTQQTVRAVDQRTGAERWNFSVGQQDVIFLESLTDNKKTNCPAKDSDGTLEWKLRVSIADGLVAAAARNRDVAGGTDDIVLWSHTFESPIAAVWMLHGSYLKAVDLFSQDIMPGLREGVPDKESTRPIMYLGSHEGQVYIQHSSDYHNPFLESVVQVQEKESKKVSRRPRSVLWQPKLATSASRTPTVVSKEIAVWNPVEYPFDNGYYFYGDVQPVVPPHETRINERTEGNRTLNLSDKKTGQVQQSSMEYWKGAIFMVIILAAVTRYIIRLLHPSRQETLASQRLPSTSTASITDPTLLQREGSIVSSSSSSSMSNVFVSRYMADFEHELCLGKGGFGVVFQARNKVDDCCYAIKRVRLPNCDEAREKVMREVKALAKLEHPSIVRYFNAWFEAPPVGWQEEYDEVYICDRMSNSLNLQSENSVPSHSNDMIRRRKTTKSRSKHSSDASTCSDKAGRHATLTAEQEELGISLDVNQLENEAFLPDDDSSSSFGIEFVDSSKSGKEQTLSVQDDKDLTHTDDGIVFRSHHNDLEQFKARDSVSPTNSDTSSWKSSLCPLFTTSGQSLLSGKHHKCKSEKCTQDTLQAPLYLFIQMQLCQRESLRDWLKINRARDHVSCLHVFEQILHAVEYFHNRGMMHRDLKPSNIFFSLDGSVKVGDFGLVTASVQDQDTTDNSTKGKNGFTDANHTGQVGTHLYMSPEQIEGKAYSYKVDVFSLGLIFFELFHSFSTEMERIKVMCDVKRKVIPKEFQGNMSLQADLVTWMLSDSPKHRPAASEIRSSDIYKNIVVDVQQKLK